MNIKILGPGCHNCRRLDAYTREALRALGMTADIEKVEEITEIMSYGILRTPGLVIDGEVVISGQVPTPDRLAELLRQHA
jgi:small redox-active disulfide protein 2